METYDAIRQAERSGKDYFIPAGYELVNIGSKYEGVEYYIHNEYGDKNILNWHIKESCDYNDIIIKPHFSVCIKRSITDDGKPFAVSFAIKKV